MLLYFTPSSDDIKNIHSLIKKQGEMIREALQKYDFGFVLYSKRGSIGNKHSNLFEENYILNMDIYYVN